MDFLKGEVLEFLKSQGDKLLLVALIVFMISVLIHLLHHDASSAAVAWIEKSVDVVLGSLLTLITGQIFRKAAEGGK
jgi:hypothetical protein